jgi:hypothetical protein
MTPVSKKPLEGEGSLRRLLLRHDRTIMVLLSIVALITVGSQIGASCGVGPIKFVGNRLYAVDARLDTLDFRLTRNDSLTEAYRMERVFQLDTLKNLVEARTLPSLILFCNTATLNERALAARGGVRCTDILR